MATPPTSTAQTRNARIRWAGVDFGRNIRPKTSCASAPVMLTSNPLNVLMNAANAPAHVMPLRIEPQGILLLVGRAPASGAVFGALAEDSFTSLVPAPDGSGGAPETAREARALPF